MRLGESAPPAAAARPNPKPRPPGAGHATTSNAHPGGYRERSERRLIIVGSCTGICSLLASCMLGYLFLRLGTDNINLVTVVLVLGFGSCVGMTVAVILMKYIVPSPEGSGHFGIEKLSLHHLVEVVEHNTVHRPHYVRYCQPRCAGVPLHVACCCTTERGRPSVGRCCMQFSDWVEGRRHGRIYEM
eukprot:COSAG01_NODE_1701_length_9447_cov_3.223363_18_plen_187_part_00